MKFANWFWTDLLQCGPKDRIQEQWMIDSLQALAFSVQANPNVYAVLLGSGVSNSAGIPTGCEITRDLIRRLASLKKDTCEPDPYLWYRTRYGKEPDYAELLEELTKRPAERQQLLRRYFEEDRTGGIGISKKPTAAHKALAALVAAGYIRVIVTTNYDRLLETALTEHGIVPTVVSTEDQLEGALPLIHTRCYVFKVNGDYRDTRIKNTPAELDSYPVRYNELLDRILDEFGLIMCGWSAEWDGALRDAICRAKSRRFTTYWAARGHLGDKAQRLIAHQRAEVITIRNADDFFQALQNHVESIEQFARPHPLSTEASVASLKLFIPDPKCRIQLGDLVTNTVRSVIKATTSEGLSAESAPKPTTESVTARVRGYEAACETLLAMAVVAGYWAEDEHHEDWQSALRQLGHIAVKDSILPRWNDLQRYPATLLLYALGIGAVKRMRLKFIGSLLSVIIRTDPGIAEPAIDALPPSCLLREGNKSMKILEGMSDRKLPINDWIFSALQTHAQRIIPEPDQYRLAYSKLELLISLRWLYNEITVREGDDILMLPGAFVYWPEGKRALQEVADSLNSEGEESPYVRYNFVESVDAGMDVLEVFMQNIQYQQWRAK